ncbi:MAG: DUF3786 domain-containing protein [Deltaproteobacteria bacterium]|nr:DUF3786 domain-containing protein [Deltaproteobacteria bacterium]MBW1815521.1 DUF3786 domain-containing protein [Deltaproteobacteria bacterium]
MTQLNNVIDILKLLDKSNCRECGEATCLAFAAAVIKGARQLHECTHLDASVVDRFAGKIRKRRSVEQDMLDAMEVLKGKIAGIDLSAAAIRVGGRFSNEKLAVKIMGKDFVVDAKGNLSSDIHVNPWVAIPLLNYVLSAKGTAESENWVPFRELPGGREMAGLFAQRCEKPLKKVADTYTGLFEDMLSVFNGKQVERHYESDISLVLRPLPKVPILICYWRPEDGLESDLNLFFDAAVHDNLSIESIYALATGLVTMFEKIALRHGAA